MVVAVVIVVVSAPHITTSQHHTYAIFTTSFVRQFVRYHSTPFFVRRGKQKRQSGKFNNRGAKINSEKMLINQFLYRNFFFFFFLIKFFSKTSF